MSLLGKSHCEGAPDRFQIWKFSDLANGLFGARSPPAAAMPALAKTEIAATRDLTV